MKKHFIFTIGILFGCAFCNAQDTQTVIYTPKGSSVTAYNMAQESDADRQAIDDYYALAYPNATQIKSGSPLLSSSRKYNCHGYAWNIVEGGSELWIGYNYTTDEDIYMSDGSYVQVCNETYPGKVSWGSGDHSAITTSSSGVFQSKWNRYPLMRHAWNYTPYGTSNLKYYVSTNISGSLSLLCSGSRTFSMQNISGATYNWITSSTLSIIAGQGTNQITVQQQGSNSGIGWVEVQVSTPCSNTVSTRRTNNFEVGLANASLTIIGVAPYGAIDANASPLNGSIYRWYVDNNLVKTGTTPYGTGIPGGSCGQSHYLRVSVENGCGVSPLSPVVPGNYPSGPYYSYPCSYYKVYPNPASDQLTIQFENSKNLNEQIENIDLYQESSGKVLKSISNQELYNIDSSSDGSKLQLDVKNLPRGVYYLHINPKKESEQHIEKIRILLE
ncbi:T9SS type A sorting domain-containing protein [Cellulophaga sp. BC115SP]|uniref:T9SS type A sorting domain-containing protein n=1 Tax=Cellulophaga sp. BC115SP TaxID=2683263 RepID=UPI00141333B0|nr:T9SS type A sorting domain-containing protein [Cellulophaga sp. BC115SP]NBB28477.1 hypothetical protein [Cellulophaga sp. BC115SP]